MAIKKSKSQLILISFLTIGWFSSSLIHVTHGVSLKEQTFPVLERRKSPSIVSSDAFDKDMLESVLKEVIDDEITKLRSTDGSNDRNRQVNDGKSFENNHNAPLHKYPHHNVPDPHRRHHHDHPHLSHRHQPEYNSNPNNQHHESYQKQRRERRGGGKNSK